MTTLINKEAERAVLNAALLDSEAAQEVIKLPENTFSDPFHAVVHRAIVQMGGKEVDLITVDKKLCEMGYTNTMTLVNMFTDTFHIRFAFKRYTDILRDLATRRKLVSEAEKLAEKATDISEDVPTVRDAAIASLRAVEATSGSGASMPASEAVVNFASYLDRIVAGDHSKHLYTGIPSFDSWLGGFYGPKLVVIGARPAVGKSAFALQIAYSAALRGKNVLLCSYEMGEEEIIARLVSRETMIPVDKIDRGQFDDNDYKRLGDAYASIYNLPLHLMTVGSKVSDIRREATRLMERGGLDAIFVDYLQLMTTNGASPDNRTQQVSEISRGLRTLSMELGVPVFALSQLNRDSTKDDRIPNMADARESGAIEQDANVFILLHKLSRAQVKDEMVDVYDMCEDNGQTLVLVIVDKNRQGRTGRAYAIFDGSIMTFIDASRQNPAVKALPPTWTASNKQSRMAHAEN